MNNIYNTLTYSVSTAYKKHDIIRWTGTFNSMSLVSTYLYCTFAHTAADANPNPAYWDGVVLYNGAVKGKFFWTPDYNNESNNSLRIKKISLGDGYEIRATDGINTSLIEYNLSFGDRTIDEITAIAHFLNNKQGVESFVFGGRPPYTATKLFVSEPDIPISEKFSNTYTLSCKLREVIN